MKGRSFLWYREICLVYKKILIVHMGILMIFFSAKIGKEKIYAWIHFDITLAKVGKWKIIMFVTYVAVWRDNLNEKFPSARDFVLERKNPNIDLPLCWILWVVAKEYMNSIPYYCKDYFLGEKCLETSITLET